MLHVNSALLHEAEIIYTFTCIILILTHTHNNPMKQGVVFILILQMKKLRCKGVRYVHQATYSSLKSGKSARCVECAEMWFYCAGCQEPAMGTMIHRLMDSIPL